MHEKVSAQDIEILKQSLAGRAAAINQWLDTFGQGTMTKEAAAFMYMLMGMDEMGIYPDS